MTTRPRAQVDVIDRHATTLMAWLGLAAVLLLLTLAARDVTIRTAPTMPVVDIQSAAPVVDDAFAIFPLLPIVAARTADVTAAAAQAPMAEASNVTTGLLGMDAQAVRATLGAPDFVRRDGSSQMWRYGSGACTLTIFLHGQNKALAVQHIEGRGLRSPSDPSADCAERLVGERRRLDLPG